MAERHRCEAPLMFERRSSWAQLLRALHAAGAKVLAIDALFADPERLLDEGLQADIDTFLQSAPPAGDGVVGLIHALTDPPGRGDEEGAPARGRYGQSVLGLLPPREVATRVHSLPRLEKKARALGFATVVEDETKVVREYEMVVLSHREALYAPLAVQAVARYLGVNRGQVACLGPSREDVYELLGGPGSGRSWRGTRGRRWQGCTWSGWRGSPPPRARPDSCPTLPGQPRSIEGLAAESYFWDNGFLSGPFAGEPTMSVSSVSSDHKSDHSDRAEKSDKKDDVDKGNQIADAGKNKDKADTKPTVTFDADRFDSAPSSGDGAERPDLLSGSEQIPLAKQGGGYEPGDVLQVNAPGGLNVRADPNVDGARIGGYPDGASVQVATPPDGGPASRNGWVYVNGPGGTNGWVSDQFVTKAGTGPVDGAAQTGPVGGTGQPGSVYTPYNVAGDVSVNGRFGAHWPTAWDPKKPEDLAKVDSIIAEMKDMGAGYTVLNVSPDQVPAMADVIQKLNDAGLTPVVRIFEPAPPDTWTPETMDRMANAAVELGRMGVGLIQLGNEPNIEGNLGNRPDISPDDYLKQSIDNQVDALVVMQQKLHDAGLSDSVKVGIPPMAAGAANTGAAFAPDTYFQSMVQAIAAREQTLNPPTHLVDWIPVHTYIWGDGTTMEPGNGLTGARGQMGWGPATAHNYEQWASDALGYAPRALSTEGGPSPNTFRNDVPGRTMREMQERAQGEMQETLNQLQQDSSLTGSLWLDWESVPNSNNWDQSVFTSDSDDAWSLGLPLFRDAWRAAQGGE